MEDVKASVPVYPRGLRTITNRLVGYSTNHVRVEPQSSATDIRAGRKMVFNFPSNALIDLRSIMLVMDKVSTTGEYVKDNSDNIVGAFGVLPWSSGLIEAVQIYANGILLNNVLTEYNTAHKVKTIVNDNKDRQMTNDAENQHITLAVKQAFATDETKTYGEAKPMVVQNWLGLFSESSTRYWDSSTSGDLRLEVLLADDHCLGLCCQHPHVLATGTEHTDTQYDPRQPGNVSQDLPNTFGVTGFAPQPKYEVNVFHAACDVVEIADGMFSALARMKIRDQGFIQINYKDYYSLLNTQTAATSQITRFSASSQSLDRIYGTFRPSNYNVFPVGGEPGMPHMNAPTMTAAPLLGTQSAAGYADDWWSQRNYSFDNFVPRWFAYQSFNVNPTWGSSTGTFGEDGLTWRSDENPNGTLQTQWTINNVTYPQTLTGENETLALSTLYMGKQQQHQQGNQVAHRRNNTGGVSGVAGAWGGQYVNVVNLSYLPDGPSPMDECALISGFDSRSINTNMTWRSQGQTADSKVVYVLVETTSSVRIGEGKSVARIA